MAEQKTNMTDEQLAQELRKSKGGKSGGKLLSLVGGVVAIAGIILERPRGRGDIAKFIDDGAVVLEF